MVPVPSVAAPVYVWLPLVVIDAVSIWLVPLTCNDASEAEPPTTPSNTALPVMVSACVPAVLPSTVDPSVTDPVPAPTSVVLPLSTVGPNTAIDPLPDPLPVACAAAAGPPPNTIWSLALVAAPLPLPAIVPSLVVAIVTSPLLAIAVRLPDDPICNSALVASAVDTPSAATNEPLTVPLITSWLAPTDVGVVIRYDSGLPALAGTVNCTAPAATSPTAPPVVLVALVVVLIDPLTAICGASTATQPLLLVVIELLAASVIPVVDVPPSNPNLVVEPVPESVSAPVVISIPRLGLSSVDSKRLPPLYDEPALNAIPAGLISQTLIPGVAVIDPSIVELAPAVITRLTIVHPPAQPV